jgi:UDP-GlcNAc:undecaprenyl-phosphate GlcNAc-1-phosphate transferase
MMEVLMNLRLFMFLYLILITLGISLLLVPLAKWAALKFNIMDQPAARKIHFSPTPYLGGAAIFISFYLVIFFHLMLIYYAPRLWQNSLFFSFIHPKLPLLQLVLPKLIGLMAGGMIIFFTGLLDDIFGDRFPLYWKIIGQLTAVALVVLLGIRLEFMPGVVPDMIFTVIWIFMITNAFNLLDNMDGLSAGVAAITSFIFFIIMLQQGQLFMAAILAAFTGSVLGLLAANFHPASIFMGDAGSQFIGFILGTLTITASYVTAGSVSLLPVIVPVIILSIPLYDTISVVIIRILERRPIYRGDQCHLSHRLVAMGFTQRGAVGFIYLLTLITGLAAVLLPALTKSGRILILLQTIAILIMVSIIMYIGGRRSKER